MFLFNKLEGDGQHRKGDKLVAIQKLNNNENIDPAVLSRILIMILSDNPLQNRLSCFTLPYLLSQYHETHFY